MDYVRQEFQYQHHFLDAVTGRVKPVQVSAERVLSSPWLSGRCHGRHPLSCDAQPIAGQ
jgi:hypothetical protein